ncbi:MULTISPECIES: NlpC/P60 family protein [Mesorhizobium]|uniref:Peptidase P60 n=1 Tax=Mesorhizobium denitrificans TaxID=2294114 RepID=A0A371XHQ8_9HYPH|nr:MULTISPECIES: NlpC/P60 family protein [Mesorhizobium]RFC68752.1 peptidase P60 [Mesorhizobium denitrificans]
MIQDRIIAEALSWEGTPYRHQACRKHVGCDCLGLVRGVWREVYGCEAEIPDAYAPDWAEAGGEEALIDAARRHCIERDAPEPGDLILFRWRPNLPAKHAGILVAHDRFIHAYQGNAVTVSSLVPQWRQRIAGAFQFPES